MQKGISSITPNKVSVRFRGRRCSGAVSTTVPMFYVKEITIEDAGFENEGFEGTKTFHDTALALFPGGGTTPTNQSALDSLALQIATDYWNWLQVSFDETYPQIIAPPPDALIDTIEFHYSREETFTRIKSSPYNGQPEELQHNDPANKDCKDVGTTIVDQTPCIFFYGPPATCVSGKPNLTRYKVCLIDGLLVQQYVSTDQVS